MAVVAASSALLTAADAHAQVIPGTEFIVNSFTTGKQERAVAAPAGTDGLIIVWESEEQDGSGEGIYAQEFDSVGGRVGTEFQINTTTAGDQERPDIAGHSSITTTSGTGYAIVWQGENPDNGDSDIYGRYEWDDSGFEELIVNFEPFGNQTDPAVYIDVHGNFSVA